MKNRDKKGKNQTSHITTGNVFSDLGFSEHESTALMIKSDLHHNLLQIVKRYGLSQRELQKILDEPQPRISEFLNGKIYKMSIEKLLVYLDRLGAHASIQVSAPKQSVTAYRESKIA